MTHSIPNGTMCLLLAFSLLDASVASAADRRAPSTTAPAAVDPKADEVLRRMGRALSAAERFSFSVHDMIDQVMDNGQKVQFSKTVTVAVRRPDGVAAEVRGDLVNRRFVYDGSNVLLFDQR